MEVLNLTLKNILQSTRWLFCLFLFILIAANGMAQNGSMIEVKGKVIDSTGESLIGASVVVQDDNAIGTVTNMDGYFTLTVEKGSNLLVSYIGYDSQVIQAAANKELVVTLKENAVTLDQVVIVSYGTAKKQEIIGSVSSVNVKDLNSTPTTRMEQALQGKDCRCNGNTGKW